MEHVGDKISQMRQSIGCRTCAPGEIGSAHRLQLLKASGLLQGSHPALERLTSLTAETLKAPVVLVSLVDIDRQVFASQRGLPEPWASQGQTPLSHSFCQHVVTDAEPLIVQDAREDTRLQDNLAVSELNVIAYAGFPIVAGEQVLGSFCAIHGEPHHWTSLELRLLREFSEAISDQVELRLDLEEIKQAEGVLASTNHELENLANILCHDLKAPLRGIQGCLQLMEMELAPLDETTGEMFEHVLGSSKRMAELIEALNTYSKATKISVNKKQLSLDQILGQVKADLVADKPECEAIVCTDTELGWVNGYAPLLRQLLQNLITNGLKFQPKGQIPQVRVGRAANGAFYVRDNGVGLEDTFHEKIFALYARGGNTSTFEGDGIGLAVCARVVSLHNGRIWVESRAGEGATFYFTLADTPQRRGPRPEVVKAK